MRVYLPSARTTRRILIISAITLLLVVIALRLFAMTPVARGLLEARLEAISVRGQSVAIDGFKGDLLGRLSVEELRVSDGAGSWLQARDLELTWSPLSLFSRTLKIKSVDLNSAEILRRPALVSGSSQSSSGGSFFSAYSVDALAVNELTLRPGVAGPLQSYAIQGGAQLSSKRVDLSLDVQPVEYAGDQVQARIDWAVGSPVTGRIDLEAAPDGMIATFLGAPGGDAVTAQIRAEGRAANWSLTGTSSIGRSDLLSLDGQSTSEAYSVSATLDLAKVQRLDSIRRRLGDRVSIESTIERAVAQPSFDIDARAGAFGLAASGRIERGGSRPQIRGLTAEFSDLDLVRLTGRDDLSLSSAALNGDLSWGGGDVLFAGMISAPQVSFRDYTVRQVRSTGQHQYRAGQLMLDSILNADDISGLNGQLATLLEGPLQAGIDATIELSDGQVDLRQLALTGERLDLMAQGQAGGETAITLAGTAAVREALFLQQARATWALQGETFAATQLDLKAELFPASHLPVPEGLQAEPLALTASLQRGTGNVVDLSTLVLENRSLRLDAAGTVTPADVAVSGGLVSSQMSVEGVEIEALSSQFDLVGPLMAPGLSLEATSALIRSDQIQLDAPTLTAQLEFGQTPAFQINAAGTWSDAPFAVKAEGNFENQAIALQTIQLNLAELRAAGEAVLPLNDVAGSSINLIVAGRAPYVGVLEGQATYDQRALDARLQVTDARIQTLHLRTGALDIAGTWPQFEGGLTFDGGVRAFDEQQRIKADTRFTLQVPDQTLTLTGTGQIGSESVQTRGPVQVSRSEGLEVAGVVEAFAGRVTFRLTDTDQEAAALTVADLDLARLGPLVQRPNLRGIINSDVRLERAEEALNGALQARVTGLTDRRSSLQTAEIVIEGDVIENVLNASMLARDDTNALNVRATVQTLLDAGSSLVSIGVAESAPIPVSVSGGGPLAPIWALVAPSDLRLEGDVSLDLNNGQGDSFRFTGPIGLVNGEFEDGLTGLHLKQIEIAARLDGGGISVDDASAQGANGGRLLASGRYGLDGSGAVDLRFESLDALNRSDVRAILTGRAAIDRENARTQITGDLGLERAEVDLSKIRSGGYVTLDVVFDDDPDDPDGRVSVREAILLDLNVRADRRVFVRAPGIDTEWGIDARVRGSPAAPILSGQARVIRGDADLLSRRFQISEGLVRFLGTPAQSEVLIRADRSVGDLTTTIQITGQIQNPQVELLSDPSLPDDEVLSRTLFGRSPTDLSPLQAAQLAGAAAQLAGGGAFNLVGDLQAATGLDRLDFGFDENGGAKLSTGAYIADDVYLEVETGVSGAPGIALEWTPFDNVEIETDIDPERGPKVAIQWKRDFDRLPGEPKTQD